MKDPLKGLRKFWFVPEDIGLLFGVVNSRMFFVYLLYCTALQSSAVHTYIHTYIQRQSKDTIPQSQAKPNRTKPTQIQTTAQGLFGITLPR